MLQERRDIVFHGFKYVFNMINKGQIHNGIISKETGLNIIFSNTLPSSLSSLIRLSFKLVRNKKLKILIIDNFFFCHLKVMKLCTVIELGNT